MFTLFNKSELEPSKSDPKNQKKTEKSMIFFTTPLTPIPARLRSGHPIPPSTIRGFEIVLTNGLRWDKMLLQYHQPAIRLPVSAGLIWRLTNPVSSDVESPWNQILDRFPKLSRKSSISRIDAIKTVLNLPPPWPFGFIVCCPRSNERHVSLLRDAGQNAL